MQTSLIDGPGSFRSLARFFAKVAPAGAQGCMLWTGYIDPDGYGRFSPRRREPLRAHVIAYELEHGPTSGGLVIDHLCRVRHCVNPGHLEAVTIGENVLRGVGPIARNARVTHCPAGHRYEGDNVYLYKGKYRRCRACNRLRNRKAPTC